VVKHVSSPISAPPSSADPADELLKRFGLRRTPVRGEVLELLVRAAGKPMSVPQILARLKGVDTVTVYRTLNTFVRKRLAHRVRGDNRTWLYAAGDVGDGARGAEPSQHLHPHFVCDECGKVECLEDSRVPATLVESLAVDRSYAVSYPEIVLHGMCPKCHG
jgi:Fur family ferric uptake transcriptional regulator